MNMSAIPEAKEHVCGEGRLFTARTGAKDIISIEGSVLGGPHYYLHSNEMIPVLAAELFDAGTKKRKKEALREALAARGATLSFDASGDRLGFSARCFPEDVSFMLALIRECLHDSTFSETELAALKVRELARLAEEKTDTDSQAHTALMRMLYENSHVNYAHTPEELERSVKKIRRSELAALQKTLGTRGLVLALTGNIDEEKTLEVARKVFGKPAPRSFEPLAKKQNTKTPSGGERTLHIAGKANVDVYLGGAVPLTKNDALYHPFTLVADMLGGGFAAHLMQTVRERDGLTYRTYAHASGFGDGSDGYLEMYASFNPARYEESVDIFRTEIRKFFAEGITETALEKKKEEVAGAYLVSLSTTRGLARALHRLGTFDRPLSYLYEYPDIIDRIRLEEARKAADIVPLSRLSLSAAGTFPEKMGRKKCS